MSDAYLQDLLETYSPKYDSAEVSDMEDEKKKVEELLADAFEGNLPSILPAGSWAKDTMVLFRYDMDLTCYFPNEDNTAGETLEEIYETVEKALKKGYTTERKTSVIRLKTPSDDWTHIDVVPGRYSDLTNTDTFILVRDGSKDRLKTNLFKHVEYIKNSGYTDIIKLAKLWREAANIHVRTFVLELLVIEVMNAVGGYASLDEGFEAFLEEIANSIDDYKIEDPANPTGNLLDDDFNSTVKKSLSKAATASLTEKGSLGWEGVFESVKNSSSKASTAALATLGASVPKIKPYAPLGK